MYGLKQTAVFVYNQLLNYLQTVGFQKIAGSMGMWTYPIKNMSFCLYVDYLGLKYFNQQDAQKFLNHLGTKYKYTVD